MNITDKEIHFTDEDLKEVFGLFCSPTEYELRQNYDENDLLHFGRIELNEEYELVEEKREYALDAVRSVLTFLQKRGYKIEKDGDVFRLDGIFEHFR